VLLTSLIMLYLLGARRALNGRESSCRGHGAITIRPAGCGPRQRPRTTWSSSSVDVNLIGPAARFGALTSYLVALRAM
jgi:hypothetical protein